MSKLAISLSILALALAAGAARAEPTDSAAPADADSTPIASGRADDDVAAQISDWVKEASQAPVEDIGAAAARRPIDRGIHGEVGASIGTGGYRSAYGVVTMPIGRSGTATVAVSDTRFRGWGGRRAGGQSFALALDFSNDARSGGEDRCRTGGDGRYVDPVWVARARRGEVRCGGRRYYAP